jgi:predicted ATPase/class 3 adenylate cyclase/DNA-binding CsgD family transcriptional regulator
MSWEPGHATVGPAERASLLPAGTVTFLLAEVEGVPGADLAAPGALAAVLERFRQVVRASVTAHGGAQPDDQGDGGAAVAVFGSAADAVAAALALRRATGPHGWPGGPAPSVRVALHTGEALLRDDRHYAGPALHRGTRLRDLAHGGQVLLSSVTASVVADALPTDAWLNDLGSHRLRDLSRPEQVFELRDAGQPEAFPRLRSLDVLATNLPVQLTSFVGRGDELAAVELRLDGERLVTLTGSGGCGKTRLAMQAAAELADRWPDGVWWVDLAPVTDPGLVAELVASTIGVLVEPIGGPLRALTRQLRDRRLLVCLDNCEHLLDAAAEVAEALLLTCPEVSVLTTSREPLAVAGETVWRVPSLADDEAVSLFTERAGRVRPWFTLDDTNEAAVRTLCRRLDGIPLAVELAAAWLRTLTPAQVAAGLDDRFALLVRGPRGVVARHQTLAASIDWSHDLLDGSEQAVFRRLAAFTGDFGLDAARAVCAGGGVDPAEVLPALGRLVDKSLISMDEREGEARYRLLETIRQYAADRLQAAGEADATRDRHLAHFLGFAEAAEPELIGADQDTWLARVEAEHDNLRAALGWGLAAADPERGRRLAAALFWLWYKHGHAHEGIEFLQRAIERAPDDRTSVQATLLAGIAAVAVGSRHFALIVDYAQRGLEVATAIGDHRNRGRCLLLLAVIQHYLDHEAARRLLAEAARSAEAAGDTFVADRVVVMDGVLWSCRDRHDEAGPLLEEGLRRCLARGDRGFAALALDYQVDAAVRTGDLATADRLATEALAVAEPLGDYFSVGLATSHLAFVKGLAGDIDGGRRLMERVVRSVEGVDHEVFVPRMAPVLGSLVLWSGDPAGAVGWYERDATDTGPMAEGRVVARVLPGLAGALRRLGQRDEAARHVDRSVALARKLDAPHLVADSLEEAAHLAADDDPERAEDLHHQALAVRVERRLRLPSVASLEALAGLGARAGGNAEATRLLAAADVARSEMGHPRPPVDEPGHRATLDALRRSLGDDGFAAAWAEGAALSLDEAVALVRRARGNRGRPSRGWPSLTPTELDVVRAVVDGLNNPEIGARLFMSRSTVKTHLSHVYAKLGVANRTELATVAARHQPG